MIPCRKAREELLRELDRELSTDRALALDEHLAHCERCAQLARESAAVEELLAELAEPPAAGVDIERNVEAIARRLEPRARPVGSSRFFVKAAVAAAAALAIGWAAWRIAHETPPAPQVVIEAPPPVAEPSAPAPEVAVLAPAEPEFLDAEPRFDPARRESALEATRGLLREESVTLRALASASEAREFAERVETRFRGLGLERWPLVRLVAGQLDDEELGRAAVRFTGARGDRLALLELERRAANDVEGVLALLDAGESASAAVAAACLDPRFEVAVAERMAFWPPAECARLVEAAVRANHDASERGVQRLAALGAAGVEALVRLDLDGAIARGATVAALERIPGAPKLVAELARRPGAPVEQFASLAGDLRAIETLPWLAELARERRSRDAGIDALVRAARVESFAMLLDLSLLGFAEAQAIERGLAALAERDEHAPAELARSMLARGDSQRCGRLLDLLVADSDARYVDALLAFAAHADLAAEERELALDAIGEFGSEEHVESLVALFRGLEPDERRLAASCLIAIERLGGRRAIERLLAGAPRRLSERVLEIFERPTGGSVSRVQLSRAVEPLLDARIPVGPGGSQ